MSESPYEYEFYINLDRECQETIDRCYKLIDKLNYYVNNCGFSLTSHVIIMKEHLFKMLKEYEEYNLTKKQEIAK